MDANAPIRPAAVPHSGSAATDETPPWRGEAAAPRTAPARRAALRYPQVRIDEPVPWSIVVLTALTAFCIVFGGSAPSEPRELLPLVITAAQ